MLKQITKKSLLENPSILVFLLNCKFKESNRQPNETYIFTPSFNNFINIISLLEEYLFIFKNEDNHPKGGATVSNNNILNLNFQISEAKESYFKKVLYDITQLVKSYSGSNFAKVSLNLSEETNMLNFKYNGEYITSFYISAEVYQEEFNLSISQKITEYIECYEAAKKVSDNSDAIDLTVIGDNITIECFDKIEVYSQNSSTSKFLDSLSYFKEVSKILNETSEQIKLAFNDICKITKIDVGINDYKVSFTNTKNPHKSFITGPIRNIKSDAHRVKMMLS